MKFTGNEIFTISLRDASVFTKRYRINNPFGVIGGYFSKTAIQNILNQPNCVGIRYYYGINDEKVQALIITGVDSNGDDLFKGQLADRSFLCPPECGHKNPLNS